MRNIMKAMLYTQVINFYHSPILSLQTFIFPVHECSFASSKKQDNPVGTRYVRAIRCGKVAIPTSRSRVVPNQSQVEE